MLNVIVLMLIFFILLFTLPMISCTKSIQGYNEKSFFIKNKDLNKNPEIYHVRAKKEAVFLGSKELINIFEKIYNNESIHYILKNLSLSPSKNYIVFEVDVPNDTRGSSVILVNLLNKKIYIIDCHKISNNEYGGKCPTWAPDGNQIVFASGAPEGAGIYFYNIQNEKIEGYLLDWIIYCTIWDHENNLIKIHRYIYDVKTEKEIYEWWFFDPINKIVKKLKKSET